MPGFRKLSLCLGTVIGLVLPIAAATAPASAEKIDGGTFHDEDTFVVEDFCAPGVTVEGHFTADGRYLVRAQGPDSILYFMDTTETMIVWTNLDTGQHATDISHKTISKDLSITVNDDGTLTIVTLHTGNGLLYGDSGNLIAKGDGQVRFRHVIDYNGTLTDPEDDIELSSELIFGSTGTNDDYCAAILADWGITP